MEADIRKWIIEKELADKMGVDYALFLGGGTIALIAGLIGLWPRR